MDGRTGVRGTMKKVGEVRSKKLQDNKSLDYTDIE